MDNRRLILTEAMQEAEQHSSLVVQFWMSPRHGVWGLGAAVTNDAATATATKRVDLENCILESG